jgi:hypothetical protein
MRTYGGVKVKAPCIFNLGPGLFITEERIPSTQWMGGWKSSHEDTSLWYIAPCSVVEVDRLFGDVCSLHHQSDEYAVLIVVMLEAVRTS